MKFPAKVVCILGMHRSGTSCLTGSLEEAGLYLAERHTWNPYNRKGNRENQKFVDLNDEVLAANNGAWNKPPGRVNWSDSQLNRARELLASYADYKVFGFKDPRVLLVLEGWKQVCPQLQFVGVFRHPNAVARSLANRDEMPREQALALWYRYNKVLYSEHRKKPFPLLCFDESEGEFRHKLDALILRLGLQALNSEQYFYDEQLRTSNAELGQALPWRVRRLYRKLLQRAASQDE